MWNDKDDRIIRLLSFTEDNTTFPERCPICGKHSGHVYMHRHDKKHGGVWVWCSNCYSFAHMSSIIPYWWENCEIIDEEMLSSAPEYLEQNADIIDRWINSLPKDLEEDSTIDLKMIGVYNEMPYGSASDLSITDYLNQENEDIIPKICGYLDKGRVVIDSSEILGDVIDPSKGSAGIAKAFTDGVWLWPGDLSYYVRNYKLKLPDEFIKTMIKNDWKVPDDVSKINLGKVSVNGIRLK